MHTYAPFCVARKLIGFTRRFTGIYYDLLGFARIRVPCYVLELVHVPCVVYVDYQIGHVVFVDLQVSGLAQRCT